MALTERLKSWASGIKRDLTTLWLAARSDRVPWYAKAMAAATVTYALSPIDLVPDFIPVLGYLDDIVIVPLGIILTIRMIPADVLADLRQEAQTSGRLPASRLGLAVVIAIWLAVAGALAWWLTGSEK